MNKYVLGSCKNYIWKMFIALLIAGMCLSISACSDTKKNHNADTDADITTTKSVEVNFINVGKGDCILIRTGTHVMMIDTGYEETAPEVVQYLKENKIGVIDTMIITHYDKDHVGGASEIMRNVNVKSILMPDYEGEGNKYKKFMKYLDKNSKMNIVNYVTEDMSMEIDNVKLEIYPPQKDTYQTDNDYSLVIKLIHGQDSFLFPGDAEDARIDELLGNEMLQCDILKVPHHGVLGMNNIQFMEEANPQYAIFTSETEEAVSTSMIYALEQNGVQYYFNCYGNIDCISDGTGNIVINQ